MKLWVVRHCSTENSEKKIFSGRTDVPLSARGIAEAARLAEALGGTAFGLVLSSPLLRARATAEAIAGGRIPIRFDDRLKERDFGDFEMTSCAREDGRAFRYNFAMRYPHGESNLEVAARVYPLLDELKKNCTEKDILLVTHGSVCRVIRSYFCALTDEEFYAYSQPNGTFEIYDF